MLLAEGGNCSDAVPRTQAGRSDEKIQQDELSSLTQLAMQAVSSTCTICNLMNVYFTSSDNNNFNFYT